MKKKAARVFLDSNVILSGLLSYKGGPSIILDIFSIKLPFIKRYTGKYNAIEIERNIEKKAPEILPVYKEYLPKLNLEIVPVPSITEIEKYSGTVSAKDVPVILSAEKCKADFLVTGDKNLIKSKKKHKYRFDILTPSEFLEKLIGRVY